MLNHSKGHVSNPDVTVTIDRSVLNHVVLGETTFEKSIAAGDIKVDGNPEALKTLVGLLDTFEFWFNIVTP